MMKKIICCILALVCIITMAACGPANEKENATNDPVQPTEAVTPKPVVLSELMEKIITECKCVDPMPLPLESVSVLYDIEEELIAEAACMITLEGAFPDEMLMIRGKDAVAVEAIKAALDVRLKDVLEQSKNYDETNYALAQTCKIIEKDGVVALFISADHENMEKIFNAAF